MVALSVGDTEGQLGESDGHVVLWTAALVLFGVKLIDHKEAISSPKSGHRLRQRNFMKRIHPEDL